MRNFVPYFDVETTHISPPWSKDSISDPVLDSLVGEVLSSDPHSGSREIEEIRAPGSLPSPPSIQIPEEGKPVVERKRPPVFARGISSKDSLVLGFMTKTAYFLIFLAMAGGGYLLWKGVPVIWAYTKLMMDEIGIPMAEHKCQPQILASSHMGDSALISVYSLLAGNELPDPFLKAFKRGRFKKIGDKVVREFPIGNGVALVVHNPRGNNGVGSVMAVYTKKVHFCDALNAMGVIKEKGMFNVGEDGLVRGPIKSKVWVQVAPRKGKVSTIQISPAR